MTIKPTLFVVTDIETTVRKRIAFDVAWQTIDRHGTVYGKGSYVVQESFEMDVPYFKEKLGHYFSDTYKHLIQPCSIVELRQEYNDQAVKLSQAGHRVILCAYNAKFDFTWLPRTYNSLGHDGRFLVQPFELLDIWHYWGLTVPRVYSAEKTKSGKYLSTSAESAYRFEAQEPDFVERHIAWHDVLIESEILLKALRRKKAMPIVKSPDQFRGNVWRDINARLGYA